jgi:uncharacterized membrane protein
MHSKTWPRIIALTLFAALAIPVSLAAQNTAEPNHPHQYHHYQLIDPGTFGGPQSFQNLGGIGRGVLNSGGAFGGWADTSAIDPLCFFDFPDCYAAHAFVWQNGAKTDLGLLPGGTNSQVNWISANGLVAGVADNGQMDPLIGIPQIRGFLGGQNVGVVDVGTLPGAYFANPMANNDAGQIVGYAANTIPNANSMAGLGYETRAFVWDATNGMQDIGTLPGGTDAMAGVINDAGEVLGWSYINSVASSSCPGIGGPVLTTHSFLWDKKNGMKDLGSLGGTCTLGYEFNNRGQVIGASALSGDAVNHPFVWESGSGITDLLGASDGDFGNAISVNKNGVIVGGSCNAVTCDALIWQKGGGKWQMTDLGQVNGGAFGISINSAEQVIGNTNTGTFLWERGGTMVDLSTLVSSGSGLQLNEAGMINDQGEISVNASDASGNNHAVLLIPCDENHPGIEGCDYSLLDAATAVAQSAARPHFGSRQGLARAPWNGRYRMPRAQSPRR